MGRWVIPFQLLLILGHILYSGSTVSEREAIGYNKELDPAKKQEVFSSSISTTQKDITTPMITPTNPITPTPTTPLVTPISTPLSPATMTPVSTPPTTTTTTTSPVSSSASWCVASQTASQTALQVALDYACGYGGADCSPIQPGGSCYNPNTLQNHASYAFNSYYQKNPVPTSCNFGGTAVVTSTDPSSGTCQYASTSTSSSVLNTTNPSGSTVFGSQPASSSSSTSAMARSLPHFSISTCLLVFCFSQIIFKA
ncbi:hypothetical protein L1049_023868 [Liquidambar formosana]|uniref:X8 domain-containing protein n=1 Tax=Liquidambar formosana TaxID=63359 RepID=A0AAP0WZ30_LIQFO